MTEKVTSLNGLKVTSEYCSYKDGALLRFFVKSLTGRAAAKSV